MKTNSTGEPFLDKVAKQADINRCRINMSPLFYDSDTAALMKALVLGGKPTSFKYSPEISNAPASSVEEIQNDIMDKMVKWLKENK